MDDDIAIAESPSCMPDTRKQTYKLDSFMIFFCLEGEKHIGMSPLQYRVREE